MRNVLALVCILVMTGCATTHPYEVDSKYVARVEQGARISGAQVHWVNMPVVATTATSEMH